MKTSIEKLFTNRKIVLYHTIHNRFGNHVYRLHKPKKTDKKYNRVEVGIKRVRFREPKNIEFYLDVPFSITSITVHLDDIIQLV